MAKRIKASKIQDAIQKAQRVGEVEDRFTIAGCEIVLRSLQTNEFKEVVDEIDELEDLAYMNGYRIGHLCRSIAEINGESIRDADFIEVEVEEEIDGVKKAKVIALERHKFVADYILASWSREAIEAAFRKFGDVTEKAELKAVDGIEFRVPDETSEAKYKRLLVEAKELEGQIPFELAGRILGEVGYLSKSSKEELETIDQRFARVAAEVGATGSVTPQGTFEKDSAPPVQSAPTRVPLNQRAVSIPVPTPQLAPRSGTLDEPKTKPLIPLSPEVLRRSRELEELEGGVSAGLERYNQTTTPAIQSSTRVAESVPSGSVVAAASVMRGDPSGATSILDQPPIAGVNPRYRPPPQRG